MTRNRYRRIVWFFGRTVLSIVVWELILPRLGLRAWSRRRRSQRLRQIARRYRALAIEMGGVLIKVGQFLSARVDVLPFEMTAELADLQDEVPPEAFEDIRRVAEAELGARLSDCFEQFDETPLAAASLGQAHRARLKSAPVSVVVKVQRPDIESIIAVDLAALRTVGKWLQRYRPIRRRADVMALLDEFARVLYEEIDYLAEGRNAEAFAAMFADDPRVQVPGVVWTHTTKRVLTLDDVFAIKITDYEAISAAGIERAEVAQRLFRTYLKQIFEEGLFHADPHPGNLFITPGPEPASWRLTFVDFGMVGRVPPNLRGGLRELAIAVGTADPARLVQAYLKLGVLLPHADRDSLERMEAQVFERFWGKSMAELRAISWDEMRDFSREFRETVYAMPFQVPEDLILLGRTVAILSGMCTGLDPHFNVWAGLAPFAQQLIVEEAAGGWGILRDELTGQARTLWRLPRQLETLLDRLERNQLQVRMPQVVEQVRRLEVAVRRMVAGVVFAALLVGGVQLYLAGQATLGGTLLAGGLAALIWLILI